MMRAQISQGDAANTADNVVGKRLTPADVDGVQRALPVLGPQQQMRAVHFKIANQQFALFVYGVDIGAAAPIGAERIVVAIDEQSGPGK